MKKPMVKLSLALAAAVLLSACNPDREPGEAAGAKVLRNLFARAKAPAQIVSFKKTQGRAAHTPGGEVYEYWYESEILFPEGYDAKCAYEKERGVCALLGIASDQSFRKNEILKSEGSLHFAKDGKGSWTGEDNDSY
jgi:hypothetical protein